MSPKKSWKIISKLRKNICNTSSQRYFQDKQDVYGAVNRQQASKLVAEAVDFKYAYDRQRKFNNNRDKTVHTSAKIKLGTISTRPRKYALYFSRKMQAAYNPGWGGCVAWKAEPHKITMQYCDCRVAGEYLAVNRLEFYETGAPRVIQVPDRVMDSAAIPTAPRYKWEQHNNLIILKEII